eukprot:Nk52_evm94s352 gene=Nk52_evmTU94s352
MSGGAASETSEYVFTHSMVRVKDKDASLAFYTNVMGLTLAHTLDLVPFKATLYFLLKEDKKNNPIPKQPAVSKEDILSWVLKQPGVIELTHNWGSENDDAVKYHDGNAEPQGFGHFCFNVPDVQAACDRIDALNADEMRLGKEMGLKKPIEFKKRPQDGVMKGIAFVKDPDGYWIELVDSLTNIYKYISE